MQLYMRIKLSKTINILFNVFAVHSSSVQSHIIWCINQNSRNKSYDIVENSAKMVTFLRCRMLCISSSQANKSGGKKNMYHLSALRLSVVFILKRSVKSNDNALNHNNFTRSQSTSQICDIIRKVIMQRDERVVLISGFSQCHLTKQSRKLFLLSCIPTAVIGR